ncbi:MAG: glycosyltransferase, partial [Proteobacteria bacterium]|nr:glycosyltransferase [Pseudomonadota bacterium]
MNTPETQTSTRPCLAMVLKGYPRISETFIAHEILRLEELGFSVRILSMRAPREGFHHPVVDRIQARVDYLPQEILPGLPRFIPAAAALAAASPARFAAAARLARTHLILTRKSATVKHLLQGALIAGKLLPGSGARLIHAHFAHSPTSVARFASILSGVPFSFFAHAKDIYTQDPARLAEKIAAARFVATCTEYNRGHLSSLSPDGSTPIHRVYHGIDPDQFSGRPRPESRPPYNLLTVARMAEKKGLPDVYQALRMLADAGIAFTHTLIGEGDDRPMIEALIQDLGLSDRCRILGARPHGEVVEAFNEADLFVLGCKKAKNGDRDGIPNVLVEALAMGVPVAATRVSALPELVRHEETGL